MEVSQQQHGQRFAFVQPSFAVAPVSSVAVSSVVVVFVAVAEAVVAMGLAAFVGSPCDLTAQKSLFLWVEQFALPFD